MSPPSERIWTIHAMYVPLGDGSLMPAVEIDPADPAFAGCRYVSDANGFDVAMSEVQAILTRIGGVVTMATRRREVEPGRLETLAVVVRWRSFVPVEKAQEAPAAERDGEPDQTPQETPEGMPQDDEVPAAA